MNVIRSKVLLKTARCTVFKKTGQRAVIIKFPFNSETLNIVRTIPGRKWHNEEKYWTCPLTPEAMIILKKDGFKFDEKLQKYYEIKKDYIFNTNIAIKENNLPDISLIGLKQELFPYQLNGVRFIESKKGRALIGDEMGLGKTVQSLAWFHLHRSLRPVIIICPASLKYNWRNEIIQWIDYKNIMILEGSKPYKLLSTVDFIIINYDILSYWIDSLLEILPKGLILDEVQFIKNNTAKRTKAVRKLTKLIPFILALSGTPIINKPVEFFNILNILNKNLFPNYMYYIQRYCNAKRNGWGWDVNGSSNTEELYNIVSNNIMIRRLKKDVLTELPDKTRITIPIELSNNTEYKMVEDNFLKYIEVYKGKEAALKASSAEVLTEIEILKQVCVKGKLKNVIQWIKDIIMDEKIVIFANHKFVINALYDSFKDIAVKIDGSVSIALRQQAVDLFQYNEKIKLFIGNIKAAGVGITLTASSKVAFIELPWTPGELAQAEDRCHRIGQKDNVTVYYLIAVNSIEEKIAKLLDEKRKILDAVLDGKETESGSLLMELINNMKRPKTTTTDNRM